MIDTAIILAGGLGTRLRPLTNTVPKPLLPLKGKPIIAHIIEQAKKQGISKIILSIGYKAEMVQQYLGNGSALGVDVQYIIETEPLGTGGAVKQAAAELQKPFFLIWGDNLMDIDFQEMYKAYLHEAPQVMMALTPREDVEHFGVARLAGGKIIEFVEKPLRENAPSPFINAGAFIIDPACLKMLPTGKSSIEKDCFEELAPLGELSPYFHTGQWFPTDTLEKYSVACQEFEPQIDLAKKKVIIADVDQTICESCQQISTRMATQINYLINKGYQFAFISGTKADDLLQMISSQLTGEHHLLAATGTKYLKVQGNSSHHILYNHALSEQEKKEIKNAFERLKEKFNLKPHTFEEDQLQDRDSQITFSVLGRHAPYEKKEEYDPTGEKRKEQIVFLGQQLPEGKYELTIGGTTSIDVTKKGLDKEWGIREFATFNKIPLAEVLYFGDKLYPGGNDYPAAKVVDCVAVRNPQETLQKLKRIF